MRTINRTRSTAVTAVLALLFVVPSATAAPRPKPKPPVCNLALDVVDVPDSPSLDVLSADVATDATRLTSVIRVKNLAAGLDPRVVAGRKWVMTFSVGEKTIILYTVDGVLGAHALGGSPEAVVKLDMAKNEVRYTTPLKHLTPLIVPGKTILTRFTVKTSAHVEPKVMVGYDIPTTGDTTEVSKRTYKAGEKSCVTVG